MVQQLLQALHALPDWNALCAALRRNEPVGVSGAAQINRSHLIAALQEELRRPALIVCQDEMAARRLQEELKAFLDEEYPLLPSRDLTFYAASAISRGWEQRRLKLLYALLTAPTTVITTWEALCLRTMRLRPDRHTRRADHARGADLPPDAVGLQPLHARRGRGAVRRARRHRRRLFPGA